jgi:putative SOS response-associated peptidase YedK
MCGRYTHKLSWKQIVELYRLTMPAEPPENFEGESCNVAPSHVMPIIRPAGNGRELMMAVWGLIPSWAKVTKPSFSRITLGRIASRRRRHTAKPSRRDAA